MSDTATRAVLPRLYSVEATIVSAEPTVSRQKQIPGLKGRVKLKGGEERPFETFAPEAIEAIQGANGQPVRLRGPFQGAFFRPLFVPKAKEAQAPAAAA